MRAFLALAVLLLSTSVFAQQPTRPIQTRPGSGFHEPNAFNFDDHTGFIQILRSDVDVA